jgi:hypothetical protein
MTVVTRRDGIRIPNLPLGQLVDEHGYATDDELTFRQALVTSLQNYMGNEGLVIPVQNQTDANTILNHSVQNPSNPSSVVYTCQLGTMLYIKDAIDYTQDKVVIAVRNDNTYPATPPVFKTVTLT